MRPADLAERVWPILCVAAMSRQTLEDTSIAGLLAVDAEELAPALEMIESHCLRAEIPRLSSLLVDRFGNPGRRLVGRSCGDRADVYEHDWFGETPPTAEDFQRAVDEEIERVARLGRFAITDTRIARRSIVVPGKPDVVGRTHIRRGWSIGSLGSGAAIEIDEPLGHATLAVFPAGHHQYLEGTCPRDRGLPDIARMVDAWDEVDPWARSEGPFSNRVSVRFDTCPLRIGAHVIEPLFSLWSWEPTDE